MGDITKKKNSPSIRREFNEARKVPSFNQAKYGRRSIYGLNTAMKEVDINNIKTQ